MEPIDFAKIETAGRPEGENGRRMIGRMNQEHKPLRTWGFEHVRFGRRILDVGCGGGAALSELAALNPDAVLTGCDISPLSIELAESLNEEPVREGRMSFRCCGVSDLPFPDGAFDTVFSVESLYFWPNPLSDLREILRVLAPGGVFMTVLEMVGGAMDGKQQLIADHLRMYCPTRAELQSLLEQAGFADASVSFDAEHGWLCGTGRAAVSGK